jgi:hypothetical protein
LGALEVVDGKGIYRNDLDVKGGAYSQYLTTGLWPPKKNLKFKFLNA